jgi:hypothetical protein
MDGLVHFFSTGKSLAGDVLYLMSNPKRENSLEERIGNCIGGLSPFKKRGGIQNDPVLKKLENVIDVTAYFTTHAAKGFLVFSLVNSAVYHFTRLLTFVALTYFFSTVLFCMIYQDTYEIAGASQDIKNNLDTIGRPPEIKPELLKEIAKEGKKKDLEELLSAYRTSALVKVTLDRVERLSSSLFITAPVAKYPLMQIIKHLEQLEKEIDSKIIAKNPLGRHLFEADKL